MLAFRSHVFRMSDRICSTTKYQRFISEEKARQLARHDYSPGDLLITKLGEPCGIACIVPKGARKGRIVADVTRFRGHSELIDHNYLSHYLNSPIGQRQVQRRAKGTTRQRINLSSLKEIRISVPSLKEQRRIAAILDKADALRRRRRHALHLLDSLIQALFQERFGSSFRDFVDTKMVKLQESCRYSNGICFQKRRIL